MHRRPLTVVILAVAAASVLWFGAAQGQAPPSKQVEGAARVIDGDTIEIGTTRVRLFGIDAPEGAQSCVDAQRRSWTCGTAAARGLERLIAGGPVTCNSRGLDDYGRTLGVCTGAGRELNATMVREGMAWAFVRYSSDYAAIEREARSAKRGVFAAVNTPPWEFRSDKWQGAAKSPEPAKQPACPIKGNISGSGERIYPVASGLCAGWGERDEGRALVL